MKELFFDSERIWEEMETVKCYVDKNGGITVKRIVFALCLMAFLAASAIALGEIGFAGAAPVERHVKGGLTRAGRIVWFEENKGLESAFANGPYTDNAYLSFPFGCATMMQAIFFERIFPERNGRYDHPFIRSGFYAA